MKKKDKINVSFYDRFWNVAKSVYGRNARRCDLLFVVALFVVLLCVRIHDINIKEQLHSDEVFSMMISTCNKYYNNPIPDGVYSGAELKRMITLDDIGSFKGAVTDIAQLWRNNGDTPHASLYYMVLRMALIGFDSLDVHELAWRGGLLNLVFFALSYFFMYRLLRRIYGANILLVLSGLAMAFGNWMSIQNTLLIREYQMAETGIILFSLVGIAFMQKLRQHENFSGRKYFIGSVLTTAAVISLGYFNAIYVIAFGCVVVAGCYRYKRKNLVKLILLAVIAAVVVALILYPGFFNFFLHDSVHKEKAFGSIKNILRYVFVRDIAFSFFTLYGVFIMAILTALVLISKNRMKLFRTQNFAWIPVVVLLCMFVIQYASVLRMPRYYYSLMPMLALIVPHVISCVPQSWKGYFELLVIMYFPTLAIIYPVRTNYRWAKLRSGLNVRSTLFRLNPNEVVQLVPCLNDTLNYTICNTEYVDIKRGQTSYVVSKFDMEISGIHTEKALLWGKQIYMYKFKVQSNENGGD